MPIEVVIKDACSTVGEGPHWDDASQTLYYLDIYEQCISNWNSVTGKIQKIKLDDTVGFVIPCKKGGVIVGLGKTFSHVDWDTKKVTVLQTVDEGKETRMNDGKCDSSGRIWAGTMGVEKKGGFIQDGLGSLYCLYTDGTVKKHLENLGISNGLAWSADNKTMYFADSLPRLVYAFDYDIDKGNISNQRTIITMEPGTERTLGIPDGMTIDTEGTLWVAFFYGGRIIRYNPDTGKQLSTLHMPGYRTSSCCFGGKTYEDLYVTCSKFNVEEEELKRFPLTGSVFKVTGLGVKGSPAVMYEG